jgi:hypothetical protein
MIGLVYYADDPHKRVFRRVYPEFSDTELDQPPTDGKRDVMLKGDGSPHTWTSFGVDPLRPVVMDKAVSDAGRKRGAPFTPANEPVVYVIGFDLIPMASADQAWAFTQANARWSNVVPIQAVDLPASLVSPTWVVSVDATPAGFGAATRSRSFGGHTVGVWVV